MWLRVADVRAFGERPATEANVRRVTFRGALRKEHAGQKTHFAAGDRARAERAAG